MGRIWTNGSGLALNAANLNGLENDVAASVKPWAPNTYYAAAQPVVEPGGTLVICNTAHLSGATYNSASWNSNTPGRVEPASYTYNADGTIATETVGGLTTTYTYNLDGTINTVTRNGVTLTYTYNPDGSIGSVA